MADVKRHPARPRPLLGAHESIAGGLHRAFDRILAVGGESLQIFTANQRQWRVRPPGAEDIRLFREKCIDGIRANAPANERHLLDSTAIATALIPKLGYSKVSTMVREAAAENLRLLDVLEERGLLARDEAIRLTRESTLVDA